MRISFHSGDSGRIHLRSNMHVPLGKRNLNTGFGKLFEYHKIRRNTWINLNNELAGKLSPCQMNYLMSATFY